MKISKILYDKRNYNILKKKDLTTLNKEISKLQNKVLELEMQHIETMFGIKINKKDYKKYKLG